MSQLHETYGKLMIQKEIIDNKILAVKKQIADEMNKERDEGNKDQETKN